MILTLRKPRGLTYLVLLSFLLITTAWLIFGPPQPAIRAALPNTSPTPPPTPKPTLQWGAYTGDQPSALTTFETLVGHPTNLAAVFVHWGNENAFPIEYAPVVRDQNKTLIIYWEADDYTHTGPEDPRFNYDSILSGKWDNYLTKFASDSASYRGPIILLPFDEMNDNVSPWDGTVNQNSAAKHIAAYQYIHQFFAEASNVKFGWSVNNTSVPDVPGNQIADYYPGDKYVDVVGVDGFNFGDPWTSFDDVFAPAMQQLSEYHKPIYIFSMASRDGSAKADWIKQGLGNSVYNYPLVGWVWFNEDKAANGEFDWRVNSDADSLSAFKTVLDNLVSQQASASSHSADRNPSSFQVINNPLKLSWRHTELITRIINFMKHQN